MIEALAIKMLEKTAIRKGAWRHFLSKIQEGDSLFHAIRGANLPKVLKDGEPVLKTPAQLLMEGVAPVTEYGKGHGGVLSGKALRKMVETRRRLKPFYDKATQSFNFSAIAKSLDPKQLQSAHIQDATLSPMLSDMSPEQLQEMLQKFKNSNFATGTDSDINLINSMTGMGRASSGISTSDIPILDFTYGGAGVALSKKDIAKNFPVDRIGGWDHMMSYHGKEHRILPKFSANAQGEVVGQLPQVSGGSMYYEPFALEVITRDKKIRPEGLALARQLKGMGAISLNSRRLKQISKRLGQSAVDANFSLPAKPKVRATAAHESIPQVPDISGRSAFDFAVPAAIGAAGLFMARKPLMRGAKYMYDKIRSLLPGKAVQNGTEHL